ncbi:SDR family NAD(P)-dependent oxidoreductase [Rhabdothermincola sediminis]|uniref:SDR family NAD(P)-dependent oxidoreductase n=1 Tax=Rhabdothermincola sediminis TaxID=2751370 RepID=UPI001AA09324|nr:SDR family oxidoreductase [Rhabdothermincola sediminis]
MAGRLDGRVAIITGAGQGIGLAYAHRFLAEGAKVVVAEINEERGRSAMASLAGEGDAVFVPTDIADEASARACVDATFDAFGTVDILVNNAALYYDIDNADNSYEYLQRVFRVNLHGAWLMARAAAPVMVEKGKGRIINQSSSAAYLYLMPEMGEFQEVGAFTYSQTKWGVIGLTKFLAAQLGPYGVTVNCIAPGVTMTEATRRIVPEEFLPFVTMMTAMKRELQPEDLTGTAVFFASDDAELVTGQVLCVDGGLAMPG